MEELKANIESFRKAAKRIIKNNRDVAYIHPSLITEYKHKCYTWKQLGMKIQHNKNVKTLREYFNIK